MLARRVASRALAAAATTAPATAYPRWLEPLVARASDGAGLNELADLKQSVDAAEARHEAAVAQSAAALRAHDAATSGRSGAQNELQTLLQRREQWTADDVERFTDLTAREHALRGETNATLAARDAAGAAEEAARRGFLDAVQRRYHGELLWQEKYRALSLYATWTLIGVNTLIFVGSAHYRTTAERDRLSVIERAAADLRTAAAAAAAAVPAPAPAPAAQKLPPPPPPLRTDVAARARRALADPRVAAFCGCAVGAAFSLAARR